MKNLHILQTIKVNVDATIVGQCVDADNNRLLVLTNDLRVYEIQDDCSNEAKLVDHDLEISQFSSCIDANDVIIVEFIVESGSLLVILKSGQFLRIGVSSFSPASKVIYKHNKSISSIKLSPDQDLIALADEYNGISILSSDCSIIHNSNALLQNDSVHKPVGVGWGSKETQFFGLDGRPSKEKQREEKISIGERELEDITKIESSDIFKQFRLRQERSTVIDWRGDGQYLATLTYIMESDKHYLKVWNRNLELQYMSDQLVTMERGLLSWIPNGQYVCCAQRRDSRINEIAMFEKNGMIHQRVTLPNFIPHMYIKDLSWSPDSSILALITIKFELNSESQVTSRHMIMLYTMQNFHYYLKYSSYLNNFADHYTLRWNPNHHNILYVSSTSGACVEYNCTQTVDQCVVNSTVVVIDSNKLLITPFQICNIPPPMSAIMLELDELISRLILDPMDLSSSLVLTSGNKLYYNNSDSSIKSPNDMKNLTTCIDNSKLRDFIKSIVFTPIHLENGHEYQNFKRASHGASFVATRQVGSNCEIALFNLSDSKVQSTTIKTLVNQQVVAVVHYGYLPIDNKTPSLILLLDDSSCVRLNLDTSDLEHRFSIKTATDRLCVKQTKFIASIDALFTLTSDSTLYVDDAVIVSNCCTSFEISDNFLTYSTTENVLCFIPIDRLQLKSQRGDFEAWMQPIENGGTLTLVSENESKVILQMPRGNLEILHPRLMVLFRLTIYLKNGCYLDAIKLARRYRVDLNFLCDFLLRSDELRFYKEGLNSLANMVATHDPSLLNLLITELSEEDTTRVRYKSAMMYLPVNWHKQDSDLVETSSGKVNKICSGISLPMDYRYLQPRLLCLLKQIPSKSREALNLIHEIQDEEEKELALKFIMYFIHVDQLFLDAISTYSTDITLMVASVSSKDPKEYLSLLQKFNSVENSGRRKYMMDLHVKNYESAFSNLVASQFDGKWTDSDGETTKKELVDLVVSKRIYRHAISECLKELVKLNTCPEDDPKIMSLHNLRTELWTKYGEYLLEKKYYIEAGLAFYKSGQRIQNVELVLDNVIKCFSLCGHWQRCVAVIELLQLDGATREHAIQRVIHHMSAQGLCTETLLVTQTKKNDHYARQLMNAREWHLALAMVTDEEKSCLRFQIINMITSDMEEFTLEMKNEMANMRSQFERLKELFLTPQKVEYYDKSEGFTADTMSTVDGSEATSVTMSGSGRLRGKAARSGAPSLKTRASTKSSKSTSSKSKKILLKVGSRYEDMALLFESQKFIENQKHKQDSAIRLLAAHVEFSPPLTGPPELEAQFNELLKERFELARDIRNALWPKSDLDDGTSVYSVYKRYGKLFSTGDSLDNDDVKLLMRPNLPSALTLFGL